MNECLKRISRIRDSLSIQFHPKIEDVKWRGIAALRVCGFSLLSGLAIEVSAGELVRNATIVEVANTGSKMNVFWIDIAGGTGPCADLAVAFPANVAVSEASFNQGFAIALAALASGNKVRIHNYASDDCAGANFISIYAE